MPSYKVNQAAIPQSLDVNDIIKRFDDWVKTKGGQVVVADCLSEAYVLGHNVAEKGGMSVTLSSEETQILVGAIGVDAEDAQCVWDSLCTISN